MLSGGGPGQELLPFPLTSRARSRQVTIKAEYIWIDGTEPTPLLRSKTKVLSQPRGPAHLGLRRLEHQSGAREGFRLRAQAGLLLPRSHPGRSQRAGAVRGAADRLQPAPDEHPVGARRGGRQVRRAGAAVRDRTGVHPVQGQPAARFPGADRVPGAPGSLLLRGGIRRHLRSAPGRGAPGRLPGRRPFDIGDHQRRGHARSVGVPGRSAGAGRGFGSAVGGPLAAAPAG